MSYQVIARKWRPKDFNELIGQEHVSQTLINALKNDRLHHALLFTGPRGTGKTSSARILAKTLRCPNVKDQTPCHVCEECTDINEGRSVNVAEIDGASNNGVDSIRELREKVGYMPATGHYKLYIIDEVHMLSTSAFNALLKTLEEPPEHVLFVMATTEVQKIPQTILSRCQRFDFRRIPTQQIAEKLKSICKTDGIKAQDEALWLIARQGDGSMRDSQSLLDQVITFCDSDLSTEQMSEILGLTDRQLLKDSLEAMVERDSSKAIEVIEKIFTSGFEPKVFVHDFLEELRHLQLVKVAPLKAMDLVDVPKTEIEWLKALSQQLSEEDIHMLFDMALKGASEIPRTSDPRIVLEMLILRMVAAPRIQNLKALLSGSPLPVTPPASIATPTSVPTQKALPTSPAPQAGDKWQDLVQRIKKINSLIAAKLEHSYLKSSDNKDLVIAIPSKMKFLLGQVKEADFQNKLSNYISTFWGPGYSLKFELGEKQGANLTPKALEQKAQQQKNQEVRAQVENHPLVKSAKDVFKTEIQAIKETK